MKKVIASAGLLALGAVSLQTAKADMAAGTAKSWMLSGTVRGFYDDNYDTQPGSSGQRLGSGGFELRPSASYKYNDGPTTFSAAYLYSLKCFTDRPGNKLDQTHEFDFSINHTFDERFSADLEESFVSSQEPEVIANGGPVATPLRANGDNIHNSVSLNLHAQITKLFGVVLGYNNGWYDYTGNPVQAANQPSYGTLLNSMTHTFTLDGRYQYDEETVGVAEYRFAYTDYLSNGSLAPAPLFIAPQTRNSYNHFLDVGVEHSFRSDFGVNAHVGIEISDYYNYNGAGTGGPNPSTVTPYVDLSVNYTYMDGGVLTLGFNHAKTPTDVAVDPATGTLTADSETSTLYATVNQRLTPISPDLSATVTFQYQDSTFDGGGFDNQGEDFYTFGLNFTYNIMPNLSTEFGYNYDLLDSQLGGRGYARNRVYVGVTASY
jgi:Putative beta-barrel porin 2